MLVLQIKIWMDFWEKREWAVLWGTLLAVSSMLQGTLAQAPRSRAWDKDSVQWLTGGKLSEEGGPGSQDVILSKD